MCMNPHSPRSPHLQGGHLSHSRTHHTRKAEGDCSSLTILHHAVDHLRMADAQPAACLRCLRTTTTAVVTKHASRA